MLNLSSKSSESIFKCSDDINKITSKALLDVLKLAVDNGPENEWSLPCLGKILCLGKSCCSLCTPI